MSDEKSTEQMIQDKNLNAPRLTPDLIESKIADTTYHFLPGTLITVCVLTLENGYRLTGDAHAVSPENFDKDVGKKVSRENAVEQIWPLEGYLLKQKLYDTPKDFIESLNREYFELTDRTKKLGAFLDCEKVMELTDSHRHLLTQQYEQMLSYWKTLKQRIASID